MKDIVLRGFDARTEKIQEQHRQTIEEKDAVSIPTILREYNDSLLAQKKRWFSAQYPHHGFIVEKLDNANSIHVLNRFEEKGYIERFQCHFRLVDLLRDVFYALATPGIQG